MYFLVPSKRSAIGGLGASSDFPASASASTAVEATLTSYDQLDFSRPSREHKPHYHSTSTLKSLKSSSAIDTSNTVDGRNLIDVPDVRKERHLSTGDYIDASLLTQNANQGSSLGQLTKGDIPKVLKIIYNFHIFFKGHFPGFNFINAVFTIANPESVKKTVNVQPFCTFEISHPKAVCKTLMKLTPDKSQNCKYQNQNFGPKIAHFPRYLRFKGT